jgi:hypothetical protein
MDDCATSTDDAQANVAMCSPIVLVPFYMDIMSTDTGNAEFFHSFSDNCQRVLTKNETLPISANMGVVCSSQCSLDMSSSRIERRRTSSLVVGRVTFRSLTRPMHVSFSSHTASRTIDRLSCDRRHCIRQDTHTHVVDGHRTTRLCS